MNYKPFRIKTRFFTISFFIFWVLFARAQDDPFAGIVPAPAMIKKAAGEFIFTGNTVIKTDQPNDKAVQYLLHRLREQRNSKNKIVIKGASTGSATVIELTGKGAGELPPEGYTLSVTPKKITVTGRNAGLFYGIQTLLQLFPVKNTVPCALPCLYIEDRPRFAYRGMMLDVSRHFFSVAEVKTFIDLLAAYKLNRFHWHLVDNEGWRIEIKKYPKLTQIGGYRTNTALLGNRDWPDSIPYGGYYTQEQIREVVQYAADRFITIVPEIEMPAHSAAALRAYPELKCDMPAGSKNQHVYNVIYCPGEQTFAFLEDVLTEVAALFPGQYIHIGGDEANKLPWKESAFCQNLIKQLNLKDEHGLQSYFIRRMEKFLHAKGKSIIGWDEILEGGLAPNATVMSWRGEAGGIESARQKHYVVMTPSTNGMYFDYAQSNSDMEPPTFGTFVSRCMPLQKTYQYDPVPASLLPDEQQYIQGVQANVWTEFIGTSYKLQYMTVPRVLAVAEIAWTPLSNKNYTDFSGIRLPIHLARLEAAGMHYRVPVAIGAPDTVMFGSQFTFRLQPSVRGAKIYYTLNGRTPSECDLVYTGPIRLFIPVNEKRELQTLVITPAGKRSVATRTVMCNRSPLPGVNDIPARPGLRYTLFRQTFTCIDQLQPAQPVDTGHVNDLTLAAVQKDKTPFGVIYEGFVRIDTTGVYNFSLLQNNPPQYLSTAHKTEKPGARLFIDEEMVIDNEKPFAGFEKKGALPLASGFHSIKLVYYDMRGNGTLLVKMGKAGGPETDIPQGSFFY